MGNSMGKKRKMATSPSKKSKQRNESHVVSLTSSSLNMIKVEFPKEIEEDLERRKIESFKALAAGAKKPAHRGPSSGGILDPAHEMYEKVRKLDVPAIMVPKPWSEVDQILSKLKPDPLAAKPSPLPRPATPQQLLLLLERQPETIDMSELMDDLDEEESSPRKSNFAAQPQDLTPRDIPTLESTLSFSTIHTVREVEGGAAKPETVTSILRARSMNSPRRGGGPAPLRTASGATPRKVNVNPSLLSRIEAFS